MKHVGMTVFLFVAWGAAAGGLTFHVATDGADTNPGTRAKPFATLERARDEIRKQKAAGALPAGGVTVEVAGGRYRLPATFALAAEDSGAPGSPIVYRCDPKARAWLFAGQDVPVSALRPLTDAALLARVPEGARAHVRCLDLKQAGIPYYLRLPDRFNCQFITPYVKRFSKRELAAKLGYKPEYGYEPGVWAPLEVFCDGVALTPARWPNRDAVRIDEIIDEGEGFAIDNIRGGTFAQPSLKEKLKLWAGADEVILHGYFRRDYYCYSVRAAKIDPEKATLTLSHGSLDRKNKPHQRFYAHHLPEELDQPGEWYLKRDTGLLCLWPPEDARTLTFSMLTAPAIRLDNASHVTLRGFGVEGGRARGIEVSGGVSNCVTACEIRNMGGEGVAVLEGIGHRVAGCDIHDTGSGALLLKGGDRSALTPAGHVAENNHIHHISERLVRVAPIVIQGVGNRVSRNLIHNIPYVVVQFNGNEHVMEGNEIFYALEGVNELGVFYTGRDWTTRGNVIRNNFVHHVTGVPTWGVRFVHLDDSASGTEIFGNVCYKLEGGIDICGGNENKIHDNLFVQCKNTVNLAPRGIDMFKSDGKGGFVFGSEKKDWETLANQLRAFKWNRPPYSERYPKLVAIFGKEPIAAPWWNEIQRNLAVDCGQHIAVPPQADRWECVVTNNWSGADPGFVEPDPARLDFRLKPDAEVYAKVGFQPIPFGKIGVYGSPERASWPVACQRPPAGWKPRWLLARETAGKAAVRIFPVADIKRGRAIVIDGKVNNEEWSPPGYDGSEPLRHEAASVGYRPDGGTDVLPATAYIETDGEALYVAFITQAEPGQPSGRPPRWGRDDAVQISLAVAEPPEKMPGTERPFIFRGYADGHVEGGAESGWTGLEVARSLEGVRYAAHAAGEKNWTAEFRIPFAAFGFSEKVAGNRPVLANLAVYRAAGKALLQWGKASGESWDVQRGRALWLKPFGPLACLPGCRPSTVDIYIKLDGNAPARSVEAGEGCEVPAWGKDGNRLMASFGTVRGDCWKEFRFRFTLKADASASFSLMGASDAWTYYDDFKVEGAAFDNPDFEGEAGKDGRCPGWVVDTAKGAGVVRPPDGAASGLWAAKANADARLSKMIPLKKGVPVTVTFRARAALPLATD